ncbi:MAG: bifunctional riboflavin kinase/FAD synthetase [bacterium]|nr:bifunctional riboflavin kinase/FAD synthetase [bacterium]
MKVWKGLSGKIEESIITSGIFDGIHIGHQALIKETVEHARKRGIPSILLTFQPHPRSALFILAERERQGLIERLGIDIMLILDFNKIKDLQPERFIKEILVEGLGLKEIWIGSDHRFGKGKEGGIELLRNLSFQYDFEVFCMSDVTSGNERVSSSYVKKLLSLGEMKEAKKLLGRPYTVDFQVIKGAGRGKEMGVQTANMDWPGIFPPRLGVYGVKVGLEKKELDGIGNLGRRPTFSENKLILEVHIFGFSGNLYGKNLSIQFLDRIRDEIKFSSKEELSAQIKKDIERWKEECIKI